MKPRALLLAAGLLAAGFVQADDQGSMPATASQPSPAAPARKPFPFDPVRMAHKHLAQLKSRLGITPDQEPAWQTYAGKVTAQAEGMEQLRARHNENMPVTAPERMAKMADMMQTRAHGMAEIAEAAKTLYGHLSPSQRAEFDQVAENHHRAMEHWMKSAPMHNSAAMPGNNPPPAAQ